MGEERKKSRNFNDNFLKDPRYSRVVKLDTGLSYDPDFHKNVRDFARTFDMEIVEVKGSAELAEKSYRTAKKGVIQHTLELFFHNLQAGIYLFQLPFRLPPG